MTACSAWTSDASWKALQSFQSETASECDLCCSTESYALELQSVDFIVVDAAGKAFQHDLSQLIFFSQRHCSQHQFESHSQSQKVVSSDSCW